MLDALFAENFSVTSLAQVAALVGAHR